MEKTEKPAERLWKENFKDKKGNPCFWNRIVGESNNWKIMKEPMPGIHLKKPIRENRQEIGFFFQNR